MAELHSKTMMSTGTALQSYCDSIHLTINQCFPEVAENPTAFPLPPFASFLPPPAPLSSISFSRLLLSYHFMISSFPSPPALTPLYAVRSLCPIALRDPCPNPPISPRG